MDGQLRAKLQARDCGSVPEQQQNQQQHQQQ
jgi:hypothetical protein